MKKILFMLLCFSLSFIGCVSPTSNKSADTTNNEAISEGDVQNSWSKNEQTMFLNQCKKYAASNPTANSNEINRYCNCSLEEFMLKYDRNPLAKEVDMDWARSIYEKCTIVAKYDL